MNVFRFLVSIVSLLAAAFIVLLMYRTFKTERSENQTAFVQGTADIAALDGDYRGKVRGYNGAWRGKTFNQAERSGINRFDEEGGAVSKYPFKIYAAKGLRDEAVDVVVLDYNLAGNPWWLKFVVDEMVSTGPNTYLGKIHVRLTPGIVFSLGYFTLEKV